MRSWSLGLAALAVAGSAACSEDAVVIEVRADDLDAPGDLDAFCLAVGDRSDGGGEFARRYRLAEDAVTELPQTLTVDSGGADSAFAWVRGYLLGIERARDAAEVSFDGVSELALTMARCPAGPAGAPALVAEADLPAGAVAAVSVGRTGSEVVVVAEGAAVLIGTDDERLAVLDVPVPYAGAGGAHDVVAFDADGDCDDDVVVAPVEGPPEVWLRAADGSFERADAGLDDAAAARAAAAADVDADGDIDLAIGGATELVVWLNDGAGRFTRHPTAVSGDGGTDVTRLGFGDLDGDGAVDLVAGRGIEAAAPARVLFNEGDGAFDTTAAALPEVPLSVRALVVRDIDGDGAVDAVIGGEGTPVRLYLNRSDGRLEDRSFVSLPSVEPVDAASIAVGDWDGDCLTDLVIGLAGGGEPLSWRGSEAGMLVDDGSPGVSGARVLLGDGDDDGDLDLFAIDGDTLGWAAR
ncbi:MAG TPA: VCBS repeat-containing protein [Kofleriaceae bacterium]|nr:VCBS repeat-containing protein [Kofleriaceae bacterium]